MTKSSWYSEVLAALAILAVLASMPLSYSASGEDSSGVSANERVLYTSSSTCQSPLATCHFQAFAQENSAGRINVV